ncbi:VOC family protein [Longimicrobium sp.]|uniref:VOC family protein n=1 Tax=Longimicrobium sp. TaxID=2029185 RepID=UPI002B5F1721|nr:VOC family protein [Longimicrobium sp.]HSU14470.1 VOC family protein [Longimicrobium sp.]
MSGMGIGITDVGQIAVNVHDVQRAIGFYRDVLGLPLLFEIPNAAFFQAGSVRLYLAKPEKPEHDHPSSILYYKVPDIRAAFESIRTAGAQVEGEPHLLARMPDHELWMAFFRDSEGNMAALMSEVRDS